ncbi:neuropeptides B/W receptor type 2-like [Pecten maximus]|uniref:neuropeptides B/W receptor type 2-like n=1 Tax=Pecten maximus TaxID=6579 RepID=UPI0014587DF6|nr:neuropeptides B/W receptor type 2-like [Pecten maximus]
MDGYNSSAANVTSSSDEQVSFAISVFFVFLPGCVFNSIAIFIIAKDVKTLHSPTNTLLFLLILFDFLALISSYLWLVIDTNFEPIPCRIKIITNPLFLLFTGLLSLILAVDRYIALNFVFFYRENVTSKIWLYVSLGALLFCLFIGSLPLMGLGTVGNYSPISKQYTCSSFAYEPEPLKKVYGITQPSLGLVLTVCIVVLNTLTIRTVLKMKQRIRDQEIHIGQENLPSHEILFANLVTVMTLGSIVCWAPFHLVNILQTAGRKPPEGLIAFMHSVAGLSFSLDPLLYVWIRKSVRKKLVTVFRNCNRCKSSSNRSTIVT